MIRLIALLLTLSLDMQAVDLLQPAEIPAAVVAQEEQPSPPAAIEREVDPPPPVVEIIHKPEPVVEEPVYLTHDEIIDLCREIAEAKGMT